MSTSLCHFQLFLLGAAGAQSCPLPGPAPQSSLLLEVSCSGPWHSGAQVQC